MLADLTILLHEMSDALRGRGAARSHAGIAIDPYGGRGFDTLETEQGGPRLADELATIRQDELACSCRPDTKLLKCRFRHDRIRRARVDQQFYVGLSRGPCRTSDLELDVCQSHGLEYHAALCRARRLTPLVARAGARLVMAARRVSR